MATKPSSEWPPKPWPTELHQYVQYLKDHLTKIDRWDSLEEAVHQARYVDEIIELEEWGINNADEFLQYASYLLTKWIPHETRDGTFLYYVITVFYYIFDAAPMKDMQTPIERVSIQGDMPVLTQMSNWIVGYAKRIGDWLDTEESITPDSYQTFVDCPPYRMKDPCDYQIPDPDHPTGGFKTFNQFFYRHLKEPREEQDKIRPISRSDQDPTKDNIICFPADSTFDSSCPVNSKSRVVIKGVHWPISALLAGSRYKDDFAGGQWAHAFLNTFNYHQQNIPVDGVVVEAFNVEGCAYLQVEAKEDNTERGGGRKRLQPRRPWTAKGDSKKDMFAKQPDAPDDAGYQFIQLRGTVIIKADNPNIGLVAVIPMGMAHVSSVKIFVRPGDRVHKGDLMSQFAFGGSDIVLVFQKNANVGGWRPDKPPSDRVPPTSFMGEIFCTANPVGTQNGKN